jgi:hypothetical protein
MIKKSISNEENYSYLAETKGYYEVWGESLVIEVSMRIFAR